MPALSPFAFPKPQPVDVLVSPAPVYNALTSLSLLTAEPGPEVDPWVTATAAALSAEERARNRLVFEALGPALPPEHDWPDFPAYLGALASADAVALRDRAVRRLLHTAPAAIAPGAAQLLANASVYLGWVRHLAADGPVDIALHTQAHVLLNHPEQMRALIVGHLRALWEGHLAAEWRLRYAALNWLSARLRQRPWPRSAAEAIRDFLGHDVPAAIGMQLDGVRHVVLVVSPHVGGWGSRFASDDTIWVFARDRREELPLHDEPANRSGVVTRLSALADETRLHVLQLLATRPDMGAQEIIAQLGLSQSNVSRHLKQLCAAGYLVEGRGVGANKRYRLNRARVEGTFHLLTQLLEGDIMENNTVDVRPGLPPELARFLDAEGRIVRWTKKQKDQLMLFNYLAPRFETGREYTEAEVNDLLDRWHTFGDAAILRRGLCDLGWLGRTNDGRRYWRKAEAVS